MYALSLESSTNHILESVKESDKLLIKCKEIVEMNVRNFLALSPNPHHIVLDQGSIGQNQVLRVHASLHWAVGGQRSGTSGGNSQWK